MVWAVEGAGGGRLECQAGHGISAEGTYRRLNLSDLWISKCTSSSAGMRTITMSRSVCTAVCRAVIVTNSTAIVRICSGPSRTTFAGAEADPNQ